MSDSNFDFGTEFSAGIDEVGGSFAWVSAGHATIGTGRCVLPVQWGLSDGVFHASAGSSDRPSLVFECTTAGWERWQARDAGRGFAERAYEIAGRLR